jgi:uncharacterized membrane protein
MFELTNIHPMIVHFPIALVIFGFIAELTGFATRKELFGKMASYLVIAGAIGVIAAYISGNAAGDSIEEAGALGAAMELHEEAAKIAMIISAIAGSLKLGLLLIKKYETVFKFASAIAVMASVIAISITGHYGGELVYKHAAGVQIINTFTNDLNKNEKFKTDDND